MRVLPPEVLAEPPPDHLQPEVPSVLHSDVPEQSSIPVLLAPLAALQRDSSLLQCLATVIGVFPSRP